MELIRTTQSSFIFFYFVYVTMAERANRVPLHTIKTKPDTALRHWKNNEFYLSNRTLAGTVPKTPFPESAQERVKAHIRGVFETAKGVTVKENLKLPWEHDKNGMRFSSETEKKRFQIKHLRKMLGLYKEGRLRMLPIIHPEYSKYENIRIVDNDVAPAPVEEALIYGAANALIHLEVDMALIGAEKKFRKGLIDWFTGEGRSKEYEKCWWIDGKFQTTQMEWENANGDKRKQIYAQRQKLVYANPALMRGMVEDTDMLPFKIKVFLDELYRCAPKTHEEAYLWYKYIVKGTEPDYSDNFTDSNNRYIISPPPGGPPNPPPDGGPPDGGPPTPPTDSDGDDESLEEEEQSEEDDAISEEEDDLEAENKDGKDNKPHEVTDVADMEEDVGVGEDVDIETAMAKLEELLPNKELPKKQPKPSKRRAKEKRAKGRAAEKEKLANPVETKSPAQTPAEVQANAATAPAVVQPQAQAQATAQTEVPVSEKGEEAESIPVPPLAKGANPITRSPDFDAKHWTNMKASEASTEDLVTTFKEPVAADGSFRPLDWETDSGLAHVGGFRAVYLNSLAVKRIELQLGQVNIPEGLKEKDPVAEAEMALLNETIYSGAPITPSRHKQVMQNVGLEQARFGTPATRPTVSNDKT
jgi:hypothetical protein